MSLRFKTTTEIPVPKRLVDQVIGQEEAVEIIKKAAKQKRNVLLIGEPGTGKSMLAQAMAELLPVTELEDVLVYPNPVDENNPKVRVLPAGQGRKVIENEKKKLVSPQQQSLEQIKPMVGPLLLISLLFALSISVSIYFKLFSDIILAALIIVGGIFLAIMIFATAFVTGFKNIRMPGFVSNIPKLLIDNFGKKSAPFIDATGARAGALLGDIKHDPFQSGGLGTPAHLRVEPGMIHRANKGVLFIDEVAALSPKSQQELLTAMQEKKYSITGQSEMSSGAMVRTEPVPCDFLLIASGNVFDLQKMHPALRSRIRGYGYEIFLKEDMKDTEENRDKIRRFVAQEIAKDKKIPAFSKQAVEEIVREAKKRSGRKNRLTLHLRDLGGLVRAAGDVAMTEGAGMVERKHVLKAKQLALTLEKQLANRAISMKKEYEVFNTTGFSVGRVNGLAVIGSSLGFGGILLPIEAVVTPAQSLTSGRTIATGKLGDIAKEAVQNVFAIIKKYRGKKISNYDVHIQFMQTYEGVEGDSASVSVATAVISALENIPVDQKVAMTGSLSVKGEVLPVGGVSEKVEAAIESGAKIVIVPSANKEDILVDKEKLKKIEIRTAENLVDVLKTALKESQKKKKLIRQLKKTIC